MNLDYAANIATIVVALGAVIGIYVALNNRVVTLENKVKETEGLGERLTVVETKIDTKIDNGILLQKLDEFRKAIEDKIELEIKKLSRWNKG